MLSSMVTVVNSSPIPASIDLSADLWCLLLQEDIRVPLTFQKKIQYMFVLPETKQVTFDAAFDLPVDVWWEEDEQT